MAAIALVVHHDRPEAAKVAVDLIEWLVGLGHEVRLPLIDADELVGALDATVAEVAPAPDPIDESPVPAPGDDT